MNIDQMSKTSQFAKDLIKSLLVYIPDSRLSSEECLHHKWLKEGIKKLHHMSSVLELETSFMKKSLARRRWYRAYNTLQVKWIIFFGLNDILYIKIKKNVSYFLVSMIYCIYCIGNV